MWRAYNLDRRTEVETQQSAEEEKSAPNYMNRIERYTCGIHRSVIWHMLFQKVTTPFMRGLLILKENKS